MLFTVVFLYFKSLNQYYYIMLWREEKKSRTQGYKTPVLVKGTVVTKFKFCDQGIIRFVRRGNKI